jgi:hypothetical protein
VADVTLNKFVGTGDAAVMAAFTPSPPSPASAPDNGYVFFNTDDATLYAWDGGAWVVARGTVSTPLGLVFEGGGVALTTGIKGDLYVPFACTITAVTLLADQSGSVVVDIWKDTYGNYPPTVADTITASAKPTLSGAAKSQDTTLTGWTTAIASGATLRFNIDSVATITRLTIILTVSRTA